MHSLIRLVDLNRNLFELVSSAGARDTLSSLNNEQRTVCGALNKLVLHVQELIGLPIQFYAQMGAAIPVRDHLISRANQEVGLIVYLDSQGSWIREVIQLCNGMFHRSYSLSEGQAIQYFTRLGRQL